MCRLLGQLKRQQLPGFFRATAAHDAPTTEGKLAVPQWHHGANFSVLRLSVSVADVEVKWRG